MPLVGPTLARRQLGRQLRQLRRAAGKTERDVGQANLASRVKLWRIETGKGSVKVGDVRGLCWLYNATSRTTDDLAALAVASNSLGLWEEHRDSPTWTSVYADLTLFADEIRMYRHAVVPGLLQTPDYFQAVQSAFRSDEAAPLLQKRIEVHVERQSTIFARVSPLRLVVVLDASVLTRPVGDSGVMSDQISRLKGLDRSDGIDVRVLPGEAGPHRAMRTGDFSIVDFHDDQDPSVVHVETLIGAWYAEKPGEVEKYRSVFRQLYDSSVSIDAHQP